MKGSGSKLKVRGRRFFLSLFRERAHGCGWQHGSVRFAERIGGMANRFLLRYDFLCSMVWMRSGAHEFLQ